MNPNYKVTPFADYLQSIVKLNALDKITQSLDNELADSQRVMEDIKDIFDSIPMAHVAAPTGNNGLRHEDVSKFLDAGVPKLLMPDMTENNIDVDLDDVIATMKGYAEDLKKNLMTSQPQPHDTPKDMKSLDLQQYASSLDQLNKRLANIKLSKRDDTNNKNANLEAKLEQLCEDVNMFTQMVQAKTTLSNCNRNWTSTPQDHNALHYDNIINKLLSGINEVTYLLQNNKN